MVRQVLEALPAATHPKSPSPVESGTFQWRFPGLPSALKSQWTVGANNVILRGALMHFQSVHDLETTGLIDTPTWDALIEALERNETDPTPYNYVYVRQAQPETLRLYVNGALRYTSLVNTGVSDAPTQSGTYPVYLRYRVTTMSGTEPDGKTYKDPGIPWVSYFHGGDALHGFIRAAYGYPQSLGCVEMPFANAAIVWPRTPIGTLVTVI